MRPALLFSRPGVLRRTRYVEAAAAAGGIVFKDSKTQRATNTTDPNLTTIGTTGLVFAAGDLIIILAALNNTGTSGTSAVVTQGAATGWTLIKFASIGPAEDAVGIVGFFKVADGTETTVDVLSSAGAAGTVAQRYLALALSYTITGTPALGTGGAGATAEATNSTPASQTITCSGETVPVLALSFAIGQTQPDQTFDTQTPDQNVTEGNSGSPGLFCRAKTKIFLSSPANIVSATTDLGFYNGLLSAYIKVTP